MLIKQLHNYNIPNNAHITLELDIESFIYVNYLDQEKVHIEYVKLNNTVRELKNIIESKINISYSRQRLFYQGKELEDNLTLMDYGLYKEGDYIFLDIIIGDKNNMGYRRVTLYTPIKKRFFVHRLVAYHFCRGYKEDLVVNHKDGNKLNNEASNLE